MVLALQNIAPCMDSDMALIKKIIAALEKGEPQKAISITYPLKGTLFPPGIIPPEIIWKDGSNSDAWLVQVGLKGMNEPLGVITDKRKWRPSPDRWRMMQSRSLDDDARISITGIKRDAPESILSGGSTLIRTSRDELKSPVFYRDVPLPFIYSIKNPETIRWRLGYIDSPGKADIVLQNLPVCGNCHSFTSDGKTLGMDVDYANDKGSYAITPVEEMTILSRDRVITWSDYRRDDGEVTFGLLSQISPDGRYVASTVKDRSIFVPKKDLAYSQLFFPIKGILAIYNREKKLFISLPGADDPKYVQSNPIWTPDGKYILYARAPAIKLGKLEKVKSVLLPPKLARKFINEEREFRFDIHRIPFNNGKGGKSEPVPGASNNGMSNFFPRISPDGKWLVFTKAKNYMLLQPDSRLYIMPAEGGTPREMNCNTSNMNSWHSWSPNGRWMVFSSKVRGAYTQLYITHIDDQGRDTPPVFLENMMLPGRAVNIPEFVDIPKGKMKRIMAEFLDDYNYIRQGDELADFHGDYPGAIKYYKKALEINPNNARAHLGLGNAFVMTERFEEAKREFDAAAGIDRSKPDGLLHKARLSLGERKFAVADKLYRDILKKWPDNMEAIINLGVTLGHLGKLKDSEFMFRQAIQREPENSVAHFYLGKLLDRFGKVSESRKYYQAALDFSGRGLVADFLYIAGQLSYKPEFQPEIIRLIQGLLEHNPANIKARVMLGKIYLGMGDIDNAIHSFEEAMKDRNCPGWVETKLKQLKAQREKKE